MNAVAQLPTSYNSAPKPLLRDSLAAKYGLKPDEFSLTVRATCGLSKATAEEFAVDPDDCPTPDAAVYTWRKMLNASALGEQSE